MQRVLQLQLIFCSEELPLFAPAPYPRDPVFYARYGSKPTHANPVYGSYFADPFVWKVDERIMPLAPVNLRPMVIRSAKSFRFSNQPIF